VPLYLVRWPNFSAALVRAADEDRLLDILDEVDNPDGCTWTEYEGPLFLDLALAAQLDVDDGGDDDDDAADDGDGAAANDNGPARPLRPEQLRVVGAEQLAGDEGIEPFHVSIACSDTGADMERAIMEFAFPSTAAVLYEGSEAPDVERVERALLDDAAPYIVSSWRQAQLHRSSDPDAERALLLDAPLRLIKTWDAWADRAKERKRDDE